jgi:hypothetical protein
MSNYNSNEIGISNIYSDSNCAGKSTRSNDSGNNSNNPLPLSPLLSPLLMG